MDGKMRGTTVLLLVTVLVAACAVQAQPPASVTKEGGEAQGQVRLRLAIGEDAVDAATFAAAVDRQSGGSITVDVTDEAHKDDPLYETRIIEDVGAGTFDVGLVGIRAFDTVGVTAFQGLMAPFLIDSLELERRVLESELAGELLGELGSAGVVGIGYQFEALRRPIGLTRDFVRPEDFAGARFGTRASKVSEMTLRALGAEPVTGTSGNVAGLHGLEGSLATAREYQRSVRSMTSNVVFWPRSFVLFVNAARFEALTSAQQEILRGAAAATLQETVPMVTGYAEELHGVVCTGGLKFVAATDDSRAALLEAVEPVYAELEKDARTKEVIETVRTMRGEARPQEIAPCPTDSPEPSAGGPSPIDGVWTTSYTKEEFANSPLLMDRGEINDQNWGDLRMTLHNGKVEFTQTNAIDHYSTAGTFTVEDDVVTFRYLTGGNADETFRMRWSLFEGTLTFERDPAVGVAPTPYVLKPWTKGG